MENIITWDFMGWKENNEPEVGLQLKWNKTLIEKFIQVSAKIHQSSFRGGADTITMSPALEGLLHPDYYDNHRKILNGGYQVILDETVDRYVIRLENLKVLENLKFIPDNSIEDEINFRPLNECNKEEIVNYIEGLVGFVIVENLFI
jgi:hypothetical protein